MRSAFFRPVKSGLQRVGDKNPNNNEWASMKSGSSPPSSCATAITTALTSPGSASHENSERELPLARHRPPHPLFRRGAICIARSFVCKFREKRLLME